MSRIGTILETKLFSKLVGIDEFGNKYYVSKYKNSCGDNKRLVIYDGMAEPSKVPPLWHAWLHYMSDEIPVDVKNYDWQKPHIPNLTGTKFAYQPSQDGQRKKVSSDYEAWNPDSDPHF